MYHLLSLLLGLAAIVFALHSIRVRLCPVCCCLSFSCCGGALLLQLLECRHLIGIGDWSALMDTTDAVLLAALSLLGITILLNILALLRRKTCC